MHSPENGKDSARGFVSGVKADFRPIPMRSAVIGLRNQAWGDPNERVAGVHQLSSIGRYTTGPIPLRSDSRPQHDGERMELPSGCFGVFRRRGSGHRRLATPESGGTRASIAADTRLHAGSSSRATRFRRLVLRRDSDGGWNRRTRPPPILVTEAPANNRYVPSVHSTLLAERQRVGRPARTHAGCDRSEDQ